VNKTLFIAPDPTQLSSVADDLKMFRNWRLTRDWPEMSWVESDRALWTQLTGIDYRLIAFALQLGGIPILCHGIPSVKKIPSYS